ncbi:MAG: DNA-directed RNA polymerase subunit alpha C-terminal domain-containing protein [Bacteroidota bacterium]
MKRDIRYLLEAIFPDAQQLRKLGFTQKESRIFFDLIKGSSTYEIARRLDISHTEVRRIKNQRFHLIPTFLNRKLNFFDGLHPAHLNRQLNELSHFLQQLTERTRQISTLEVRSMALSTKTINALVAFNIRDTATLCRYSEEELRQVRHIGDKAILEIKQCLQEMNLSLKT